MEPRQKQEQDLKSFSESLFLRLSQSNQNNNPNQNPNPNPVVQIQLPFPPVITPEDIVLSNDEMHAKYRIPRHFNGFTAYRCAVAQHATSQGLNLPFHEISPMASRLWGNEPSYVKAAYKIIAHQAENNYRRHNSQFPELSHRCEGYEECAENE